jgi:PTH1 family peptidyl-tRNA hydrolase
VKVVAGLGNPGPEYDETRHNVGWWAVDRLAHDWGFGGFRREGPSLVASGRVEDEPVLLVKPTTFMNRSGRALVGLFGEEIDPARDLLVVVDDVALEVGRVRLRASGSPGGHNGLKSVVAALGTQEFARLRIGVGIPTAGDDMVEWVLSPMPPDDEDVVVGLLPELTPGVQLWVAEGPQAAMNRLNR